MCIRDRNQEFSSIEKAPRPAESLLARRDDERDPHDERWAEALIADAEPAQPARGNPRQEPSLGEPLAEERAVSYTHLAQHVLLRFVNAEGYYLYRHRFQFKVEPAQVSLGQVQLPAGKQHHDEYFGDTEVYYNIVDLKIPLNNPARQP